MAARHDDESKQQTSNHTKSAKEDLSYLQVTPRKNVHYADMSYPMILQPGHVYTGQQFRRMRQSDVICAKNISKFSTSFDRVSSKSVGKMTSDDGNKLFSNTGLSDGNECEENIDDNRNWDPCNYSEQLNKTNIES